MHAHLKYIPLTMNTFLPSQHFLLAISLLLSCLTACGQKLTGDIETPPHSFILELPTEIQTQWLARGKSGEPEAQFQLGKAFLKISDSGFSAIRVDNSVQAIAWLERAAYQDHIQAMLLLFKIYKHDDLKLAIKWLSKAAEKGDVNAMYMLASEIDFSENQFDAGDFTYNDKPKPISPKALDWYEKAAANGHADALSALGNFYRQGSRVKKDIPHAIQYLEKAASAGDDYALFCIGEIHEKGEGGSKNLELALKYYLEAASHGNSYAEYHLSQGYAAGTFDGTKNLGVALAWLKKAAEHDNTLALTELGKRYANGDGVQRDAKRAIVLWEKASRAGCLDSEVCVLLGQAYATGKGVTKNSAKAIELWGEASKYGNAEAAFLLGQAYLRTKQLDLAAASLQQAAKQKYAGAEAALNKLCQSNKDICDALPAD